MPDLKQEIAMWFQRAKRALDEERQQPFESLDSGDFYETLSAGQTMDLQARGLGDSVLDLRAPEEQQPKPVSHFHEHGDGEIFYDVLPIAQQPNIFGRLRAVDWAEKAELAALVVVLAVTVLVGAGLIYAAAR